MPCAEVASGREPPQHAMLRVDEEHAVVPAVRDQQGTGERPRNGDRPERVRHAVPLRLEGDRRSGRHRLAAVHPANGDSPTMTTTDTTMSLPVRRLRSGRRDRVTRASLPGATAGAVRVPPWTVPHDAGVSPGPGSTSSSRRALTGATPVRCSTLRSAAASTSSSSVTRSCRTTSSSRPRRRSVAPVRLTARFRPQRPPRSRRGVRRGRRPRGPGRHAAHGSARAVGTERLVGISTHSRADIEAATGADYLGVGTIFATPTKEDDAVGLELVRVAAEAARVPWFAIGGIDHSNVGALAAAGAWGVAVVRAIRDADDPESAARALRAAVDSAAHRS